MFRCGKYLGKLPHFSNNLNEIAKLNCAKYGIAVEALSSRCLSTSSTTQHWKRNLEFSTNNNAWFTRYNFRNWQQDSHRSYTGGQKDGNNSVAIIGALAAALVGGVLFFSSYSVTTVPGQKNDKKTAKSDDEKGETQATPEPEAKPLKFPEEVTYLIIGAGTAAMTAAKTIRTTEPAAKVLMVTEESYRPYMRPPLSKELWFKGSDPENLTFNDWAGKEKNVFYQPEEFFLKPELLNDAENGGIAIAYSKKVDRLDVSEQKIYFADGKSLTYDKCLLATGGKPRNLPVFERADSLAKERIHLFRNIDDFQRLQKATDKATNVMVVGGGFLGSEIAVALAQKGKERNMQVHQVFPEDGNMGLVFPDYLSKWTMDKVSKEGVTVHPNSFVVDCSYHKKCKKLAIVLQDGEKLCIDEVVVAVGLQPNIELAEKAGLEVDNNVGGFLVNAELEARRNLWVAGDVACFYDVSLGRRRVEHHDHAVVSGRLAGKNMTGQGKPYWHQSMFWSDLGPSVGYEAIGICNSRFPTFSVFAKATKEDTPKAVVEQTGEAIRSETESGSTASSATTADIEVPHPPVEGEDYGKGVIFYTKEDKIVGIILWNLFGRMPIARQVLKEGKVGQDLAEVARLFDLHDQKKPQSS